MHLVCVSCGGVNRVPEERMKEHPKCGKCQGALLPAKAVEVNQAQFQKLVGRSDLPVVVDFWAKEQLIPLFFSSAQSVAFQCEASFAV